jgi:hypothetical protein
MPLCYCFQTPAVLIKGRATVRLKYSYTCLYTHTHIHSLTHTLYTHTLIHTYTHTYTYRWMYRVPQVQLDDINNIALCFPSSPAGAKQLRTLMLQMTYTRQCEDLSQGAQAPSPAGLTHTPTHTTTHPHTHRTHPLTYLYFASFKKARRAWCRWRARSR